MLKQLLRNAGRLAGIFGTALLVAAVAGCSKQEPAQPQEPADAAPVRKAVNFNVGFGTGTRLAIGDDYVTRFTGGEAIGIYAVYVEPEGGDPDDPDIPVGVAPAKAPIVPIETDGRLWAENNYADNVKMTYNIAAQRWEYDGEPIYWPEEGALKFYAYYPYDPDIREKMTATEDDEPYRTYPEFTFVVQPDQSTPEAFWASDYMQAVNPNELTEEDAADGVSLVFHHVMALWEIEIVAGEGAEGLVDDGLHVELYDWRQASLINLRTDYNFENLTSRDDSYDYISIPMLRVEESGAGTYTYRALAPWYDKNAGRTLFTITTSGGLEYTFENPAGLNTWDNEAYRYRVTLNPLQ